MTEHGGNLRKLAASSGIAASDLLDFSANVNPLGAPEWLRPAISRCISDLVNYPDPECVALRDALAQALGVSAAEIVPGNGSNELLYALPRALKPTRMLLCAPCYIDYAAAARAAELPVATIPLSPTNGFTVDVAALGTALAAGDLVVLGAPNNPTGAMPDLDALLALARQRPDATFVLDEAFIDFVADVPTVIGRGPANVIVLRSFTKFYAIPGLRLGCCVATPELAARIRNVLPDWSVNSIAQEIGRQAVQDLAYGDATRQLVRENREALVAGLRELPGCTVYPGSANYLLARLDGADSATGLADKLLRQHRIAIRACANYDGLDARYFRVAVRTAAENERLLDALAKELLATRRARAKATRRTPSLMFQGTTSNAGKSVLTAAMCRILLQDGLRVAPFKAQNMSNNSCVTPDGGEIGRAQVTQAQACRIEPDVRMNPILLKPNCDTGSQVVLRGKSVGNMNVRRYTEYKAEAVRTVHECYDSLAAEYDVMVIEGAGSPGEVNLKRHDLVNMAMARYAQSPVLLVGDIDRGGVYAAFVGTMEVLAEWERRLVAGFVVNRFRGDASLLQDAHDYVLRHSGVPVLGVVPYLKALGLPEEDSVEFKSGRIDPVAAGSEKVTVAVVDLPHISNFTDIDALRLESDLFLKIARTPADLDGVDAIILPGSKNTIGDILALRAAGFAEKIAEIARRGDTEIVGICGGFQMLGREICDPAGVESDGQPVPGFGLLPMSTTMAPEKTLTRVKGTHLASGLAVAGYEIHHGQTVAEAAPPAVLATNGASLGIGSGDGLIWGSYLHGIFDADPFRRWFVNRLRARRNLPPAEIGGSYNIEPALDRLAEIVRQGLDMTAIYRLLGL